MSGTSLKNAEVTPAKIQIIAGAMMASVVVHAALGVVLTRSGILPGGILEDDETTTMVLNGALLFAGVSSAMFSFVIRKILAANLAKSGVTLEGLLRLVIVSLAMAEGPGMMGLVLALTTGELLFPGLLWGISFAVSFFHFPTRAWIENMLADQGAA